MDGTAHSDRAKALVVELRALLAGLIEARRSLPHDKPWKEQDYLDDDDISRTEIMVSSAITVAKHKTPDRAKLAERLDEARKRLAEVANRRPSLARFLERVKQLLEELLE